MELLRSLFSLVAYKMPLRSKSTICHYSNLSFFVLGFVRFSLSFSSQEEIVKRETKEQQRKANNGVCDESLARNGGGGFRCRLLRRRFARRSRRFSGAGSGSGQRRLASPFLSSFLLVFRESNFLRT